jgi:hypothetical protein
MVHPAGIAVAWIDASLMPGKIARYAAKKWQNGLHLLTKA